MTGVQTCALPIYLQVLALVLGLDDKTEENQKAVDLGVDIIATDHPEKFIMKYGQPSI